MVTKSVMSVPLSLEPVALALPMMPSSMVLMRKVAAVVRKLGERAASSARAAAVAVGGLHAGTAFDKAAQERDAAAAVASMVAAAVAAEGRARSVAAARVGLSHETQAEIGLRVYCKLELLEGQIGGVGGEAVEWGGVDEGKDLGALELQ